MGKTSGGRPDPGVRAHRIANRRDSVLSWGRRGRGASARTGGVSAAGSGTAAWRRRERAPQPRRPMEILTSIYALLSGGQGVNPKIDSIAFRLHCGATTAALLAASAALTTRHLVGNPIDCIHTRDIPEDVLNTYCWIHSTFTVAGEAGGAYPGVRGAGSSPRRYGKYYQWVAFTLFFQGPTLRVWYGLINRYLGSGSTSAALKKVFFDQIVFTPPFLFTILSLVAFLQGKDVDTIKSDLRANYLDVLKSNYLLWPWVQIVNFAYVPLHYQVLLVQIVALVWNTYLSWKINKHRGIQQ